MTKRTTRVSPFCWGYRRDTAHFYLNGNFIPCVRGVIESWQLLNAMSKVYSPPAGVIAGLRGALRSMDYLSPACGGYLGYIERITGK